MYIDQLDKQKRFSTSNDQDVMEQLKDELRKLAHDKIINEEMIQRLEGQLSRNKNKNKNLKAKVSDFESCEKRLTNSLAERDRDIDIQKT